MSWVTGALVFVMIWWVVFFCLLPIGVEAPEEPEPGHAPSAPTRPHLAMKALGATVAAVLLLLLFLWLRNQGYLAFILR